MTVDGVCDDEAAAVGFELSDEQAASSRTTANGGEERDVS